MKSKTPQFNPIDLERKFKGLSTEYLEFSQVQLAHEVCSTKLQIELIKAELIRRRAVCENIKQL